ncbi:hypothetical protein Acy02nite_28650 [Actinoplanes cyaneus]|uniref:OmpR/PhoB-type domain-containing protein n=1 Tax=Actinoplanes cyaneus TaxID=52696 RepID=A0A919M719_9ACTN|nr:BTAD domain-containing putative transcriptional regulator [Actinoplanes cyaneus]MCW2137809.1 DNA-binding transcriptional activator of the SARP family [Actinoplanes cyaneus]GID64984.1 hypothetical protein Acy02nite_28650 [Actinoplanes cyaneus]
MVTNVSFGVLGPVEAWAGDRRLRLGPPQQRTVLAAILLNEGLVASVGHLVEALWGEEPPAGAVKTVRTYVSRIRAVLEPAGAQIESESGGYQLRVPPDRFDLARFRELTAGLSAPGPAGDRAQRARQALQTFRGEPLAGLSGEWAQAQRSRLSYLRAAVIEAQFAAELEAGRHTEVIAELPRAIQEFPFRERLRELHILALYQAGLRAEAFVTHRAVLKLLSEELGVEPMPALRDLHRRMVEGDPTLAPPERSPVVVPRQPGVMPRQPEVMPRQPEVAPREILPEISLRPPPRVTEFIGREAVVAELTGLLRDPGRPVLIGIDGLAGIGKTALAVHVSTLVRDAFPDGVFMIDLGGAGGLPVEPAAVLRHLMSRFGISESAIPPDLSCRSQLWRNLLSQRRVLLVLDAAADSSQLAPLIPETPGSAMIVTNWYRHRDVPGVRWTTLGGLGHDDAWRLLERSVDPARLRRDPEPVNRLIELASGHPVPLRVVANHLLAHPQATMAEAEHHIRDEYSSLIIAHLDSLDARWRDRRPYWKLEPDAQRALRLLAGLNVIDMSSGLAAHVLEIPQDRARQILARLADFHLVEAGGADRYGFSPFTRAAARRWSLESDSPAARDTVRRRGAEYVARNGSLFA